jgi:hypothetical protein
MFIALSSRTIAVQTRDIRASSHIAARPIACGNQVASPHCAP